MFHWGDVLEAFGLLLAGLCLCTVILQAACALYNKFWAVSVDSRSEQRGYAGEGEIADEARRMSTLGGTVNPSVADKDWPGGVPKLDFPRAFGIILVTTTINAMLGFLTSRALRGVGGRAAGGRLGVLPVACLMILPVGMLVMGALLPTSFGKGLLVALLYSLLWLALGSVILAVYFVAALAPFG